MPDWRIAPQGKIISLLMALLVCTLTVNRVPTAFCYIAVMMTGSVVYYFWIVADLEPLDRRAWGYALRGDGTLEHPFTPGDRQVIEQAKAVGWRTVETVKGRYFLVKMTNRIVTTQSIVVATETAAWALLPDRYEKSY